MAVIQGYANGDRSEAMTILSASQQLEFPRHPWSHSYYMCVRIFRNSNFPPLLYEDTLAYTTFEWKNMALAKALTSVCKNYRIIEMIPY